MIPEINGFVYEKQGDFHRPVRYTFFICSNVFPILQMMSQLYPDNSHSVKYRFDQFIKIPAFCVILSDKIHLCDPGGGVAEDMRDRMVCERDRTPCSKFLILFVPKSTDFDAKISYNI
jgi:hypothetical protein